MSYNNSNRIMLFKKKNKSKIGEPPSEGLPLTMADDYNESLDAGTKPGWVDEEEEEGRLSVDVYQDDDNIIIKSTIAGVEPENLEITLNNDMLTIRGSREIAHEDTGRDYLYQECYWGSFSRSIILPVEVDINKIDAAIKNGILTITLPKVASKSKKKIRIKNTD